MPVSLSTLYLYCFLHWLQWKILISKYLKAALYTLWNFSAPSSLRQFKGFLDITLGGKPRPYLTQKRRSKTFWSDLKTYQLPRCNFYTFFLGSSSLCSISQLINHGKKVFFDKWHNKLRNGNYISDWACGGSARGTWPTDLIQIHLWIESINYILTSLNQSAVVGSWILIWSLWFPTPDKNGSLSPYLFIRQYVFVSHNLIRHQKDLSGPPQYDPWSVPLKY